MTSGPIKTSNASNTELNSSSAEHEASPAAGENRQPTTLDVSGPLSGLRERVKPRLGGDSAEHSKNYAREVIHIHEMWDRPTLNRMSAGGDAKFREGLSTAYLTLIDGISGSKANVDAHLWTEQASPHALYRPIVKSNGSEVEIPHSLIASRPVSVHLKGEIPALADRFPSDFRKAVVGLHNHSAGENIGVRADINRAIYTTLYKQSGKTKELNVHIDTDTLAVTRLLANSPPEADVSSDATIQFSDVSNMANEKARLSGMHAQLNQVKLNAEPRPLSKEDVTRLSAMPQKSWSNSSSYVPARQGVSAEEQENIDRLREIGFSSHSVTPLDSANDVLVVAPLTKIPGRVLRRTIDNFNGNLQLDLQSDWGKIGIVPWTKYLMELNRDPRAAEATMKKSDVLDYFILAEKIRKNGPTIDAKINALSECIQKSSVGSEERKNAEYELGALRYIRMGCKTLVESFVNENTFFPQVRDSTPEHMEAVNKLTKTLFGVPAPITFSDSWHDAGEDSANTEAMAAYSPSDEVARRVFGELKGMLRASTTEDHY